MFTVGVLPALLVLYIPRNVTESPVWKPTERVSVRALCADEMTWLASYDIERLLEFRELSSVEFDDRRKQPL
jgi:hypothetical protein